MIHSRVKFDFEFIDPCLCNAWVATAVIGSAVIGAASTAYAANKASDAQVQAANQATQTQLSMYDKTRGDLSPYRDIGQTASTELTGRLKDLTSPIAAPEVPKMMTQEELEKTPGYQFNLAQGLKATQNSAAARALGTSGAALKGAAAFATGLANSTYQNQFANQQALFGNKQTLFQDAVTNQTNAYNRLKSLVDVGASAAAGTGAAGQSAATGVANAQIGAGNAQAAAANATGAGITNAVNSVGGYAAYKGLYGNPTNAGIGTGVSNGGYNYIDSMAK